MKYFINLRDSYVNITKNDLKLVNNILKKYDTYLYVETLKEWSGPILLSDVTANLSTRIDIFNHTGIYVVLYDPLFLSNKKSKLDLLDKNIVYFGETSSFYKYGKHSMGGLARRIYMFSSDLRGLKSNHEGKIYNTLSKDRNLTHYKIWWKQHPKKLQKNREFSEQEQFFLTEQFLIKHKRWPVCNVNGK